MDEMIYYNELYDLYGCLLTDKQREYFEEYYFNNLSFSEIADNFDISRNAVFKQLHIVTDKLLEYEEKLKYYEKKKIVEKIILIEKDEKIREELEKLF